MATKSIMFTCKLRRFASISIIPKLIPSQYEQSIALSDRYIPILSHGIYYAQFHPYSASISHVFILSGSQTPSLILAMRCDRQGSTCYSKNDLCFAKHFLAEVGSEFFFVLFVSVGVSSSRQWFDMFSSISAVPSLPTE